LSKRLFIILTALKDQSRTHFRFVLHSFRKLSVSGTPIGSEEMIHDSWHLKAPECRLEKVICAEISHSCDHDILCEW
jgi:hypothetical protein